MVNRKCKPRSEWSHCEAKEVTCMKNKCMQSGREWLCTLLRLEFPQPIISLEANHNTKLSIWSQMLAPTHKSSILHPTLVINKQELFSEYANPASRQTKAMKNAWKNNRNHLLITHNEHFQLNVQTSSISP